MSNTNCRCLSRDADSFGGYTYTYVDSSLCRVHADAGLLPAVLRDSRGIPETELHEYAYTNANTFSLVYTHYDGDPCIDGHADIYSEGRYSKRDCERHGYGVSLTKSYEDYFDEDSNPSYINAYGDCND